MSEYQSEANRADPSTADAQQSARGGDRNDSPVEPSAGRRHNRAPYARIIAVVGLELGVPLAIGLLMLVGWVWVWTPSDGFWAGRAQVHVSSGPIPTADVDGAKRVVPSSNAGQRPIVARSIEALAATKPPTPIVGHHRLGDVIPSGDQCVAVIYDEGTRIRTDSAPRSAPAARSFFFASPAFAGQVSDEQRQLNAEQLHPPNEKAPADQSNRPAIPRPSEPVRAGVAIHPSVVRSAAINAVLHAEYDGAETLVFLPHQRIDADYYYETTLASLGAGLAQVGSHFDAVRRVYLPLPADETQLWPYSREPFADRIAKVMSEQRSGSLASGIAARLITPLAWPGGKGAADAKSVAPDAPDAELVNPSYLTVAPRTPLPAIMLVVVLVAALVGRLRTQPPYARRFQWRGLLAASLALVVGFVFLQGLQRAWHSELAVLPGVLFVGALAALLDAALLLRVRGEPAPPEAPVIGVDGWLRSVLHSDRAVEDLREDRLNFTPLVTALSRFLDNPDTLPPVVISVNGPWGSGKSSLMKMLATELEKTRRFRIVWYNAWQYNTQDQILAAFLQSVAAQLSRGWTPLFALRLAWTRFRGYSFLQYLTLLVSIVAVGLVFLVWCGVLDVGADAPKNAEGAENIGQYVALLLSGIGLGGVAWLARFLRPFHLQFKQLYAVNDHSARIGFLEEFTREFRLYRDSVGRKKFLIIIDDLDRCPPEHVVDVLKAINLIISSGDGAGRSFFLLGYDPKYILRSIEHYYRQAGSAFDQHFGPEYLKKMVTVSVSVPVADPNEIQQLVAGIDGSAGGRRAALAAPQAPPRRQWQHAVPDWMGRLSLAALTLFMLSTPLLLLTHHAASDPGRDAVPPASPEPAEVADVQVVRAIDISTVSARLPTGSPWWWWVPLAVPIVLGLGGIALLAGREPVEGTFVQEEKDSPRFRDAIKQCGTLLPHNPRDVVRTINLMRMEYLVQGAEADADRTKNGAPAVPRLDEWECVSYTLLQQRHPEFFDPAFLQQNVLPSLASKKGEPAQIFRSMAATPSPVRDDWAAIAADLTTLSEEGAPLTHFADAAKLKRFVDVNWFVLDVGWRPEPRPSEDDSKREAK